MITKIGEEYVDSLEAWRANREASLRREYGWLSLAGLFWLTEGENPFGSAAENSIRLSERAPAQAGVFSLRGGQVTVKPTTGVKMRLNTAPLGAAGATLKADTSGEPDYLFVDNMRLGVIERAGKLAIRVWDPQNPLRQNFAGCRWCEPEERWKVNARVEAYAEPKEVHITDSVGNQRAATMHAALRFEISGRALALDAERLEDGSYDLIFKDSTAGKSTYSAGRYLTTEIADGNKVVIDFNKAYNPPCAFTEFATCPLPLPQNVLPIAIEAGEQYQG